MTPRPPCCAMAMARRLSVTVSIAALRIGTLRRMRRRESRADVDLAGQDLRVPGHEQDVVEREGFGKSGGDLRGRAQSLSHRAPFAAAYAPWHFLYFFPLPQ